MVRWVNMGFFYFDESVHAKANFALGAFAYSESSLDQPISDALRQSGLEPCIDEFKSGSRMDRHPEQATARQLLRSVISNECRIGIVVAPASPLQLLGSEALRGLGKILSTNGFRSSPHDVFFDEGMFSSSAAAEQAAKKICGIENCKFHFEQDSVTILGLQIADLIAHTCATMLLAQLGFLKKTVKVSPDSGYDPDMPLEFELWLGLRWNFFAASPPQGDFRVDVGSRGLHISDSCDDSVKSATLARFGSMYVGCTH